MLIVLIAYDLRGKMANMISARMVSFSELPRKLEHANTKMFSARAFQKHSLLFFLGFSVACARNSLPTSTLGCVSIGVIFINMRSWSLVNLPGSFNVLKSKPLEKSFRAGEDLIFCCSHRAKSYRQSTVPKAYLGFAVLSAAW